MKIKVKKLHPDAVMPIKATVGSAGFDLCSVSEGIIPPGLSSIIYTGLSFEIPYGYFMSLLGRSGMAFNYEIISPTGTIDSDYRGEVKVKLFNLDHYNELHVKLGDRIAQAVILPVPEVEFIETEELTDTDRGSGGFGHTGR